jgi:hypothetical protein
MRNLSLVLLVAAAVVGCSGGGEGSGLLVSAPGTGPGIDAGDGLFPNLTLQGLRSAAAMAAPEPISTWESYDPDGLHYDLLHVMAICLWCSHCSNETNAVAKIAAWQADHRVAALQIAIQGYGSASPTWSEVQRWAREHNVGFPVLMDGQAAQLGQYFSVSSVPLNIAVDPRTMAVLGTDRGEVGDVQAYEQGFLDRL